MKTYKKDFPFFSHHSELVYLDTASTSQKPKTVIDAISNFYTMHNANTGRGIYALAEQATILYEQARKTIAGFIGADAHELIFTRGATDGVTFVVYSWAEQHIQEGDTIIVTTLEHHSNFVPWQQLAHRKKAKLLVLPLDEYGSLVEQNWSEVINEKVKLVAMTHISNTTGMLNPYLQEITQTAHTVGAKVLIDGCQAVAHIPVDVKQLDADFYVFSGHKMYGPTGIGGLYIKQAVQKEVIPYAFGGGSVFDVQKETTELQKAPWCYEPGTGPLAQAVGLQAAVEYIQSIGIETLEKHSSKLSEYFIFECKKLSNIQLIGDENLLPHAHTISFMVADMHAHDVAALLDQHGICVRAGNHCAQLVSQELNYTATVRVSFGIYNTKEDIDKIITVLKDL